MDESWSREFGELDASDELRESIKPELEPGERLLWVSRPGRRALKKERGSGIGGLVWAVGLMILSGGCFLTSFIRLPWFETQSALFAIIAVIAGVISFLVFLGLLSGLVSTDPSRANLAHQVYALTDHRAIIKTTDPKTRAATVLSYYRGTIKPEHLHRTQYPDGSGDVIFQENYRTPPGFQDVAEVRRVESIIRRFLIASDPGSAS